MSELKFVLWNCSGLRATTDSTAHKMGFFDKEMPNANFSIANGQMILTLRANLLWPKKLTSQ